MEETMFLMRWVVVMLLCITLQSTATTATAAERCTNDGGSALCQQVTQCINNSLNRALSGELRASDVLNVDLLRQRALRREERGIDDAARTEITDAYTRLINQRFASNRSRFANATLSVRLIDTRQRTHVVDGFINAGSQRYTYRTFMYFTGNSCKFYDVNIEGIFQLSSWLRNHSSLTSLYERHDVDLN